VTCFTGAVTTERLIRIGEQSMRMAHTVTDGPLHAEHYNAPAQVVPYGGQHCRSGHPHGPHDDSRALMIKGLLFSGAQPDHGTDVAGEPMSSGCA